MKTISKLYHGTSAKVARKILREGITVRAHPDMWNARPSRWENHPSRNDCVYLTEAYAGYFAANASIEGEQWGIIEVDATRLDSMCFLPDEDAIEQGSRGLTPDDLVGAGLAHKTDYAHKLAHQWGVPERTQFFRDHLESYRHLATESLRLLGNIVYQGNIPTSAITRVSFFDPRENPAVAVMCMDAQISTLNYQLVGAKYRDLTKWFFGEDYCWAQHSILPVDGRAENAQMFEALNPGKKLSENFLSDMDKIWAHPQDSLSILDDSTWKETQSA